MSAHLGYEVSGLNDGFHWKTREPRSSWPVQVDDKVLQENADYDRTMTAPGDCMHAMYSVPLESTAYTAARRF